MMKLFNQQDSLNSENSRKSARISKNSKERESKRESGHNRFLYWFTQQQGYVQSLTYSKDFTKTDQPDHVYNTCPRQDNTTLATTTAEPTADQETPQNPLCASRTPLLKPTTSHSYTESTV